MTEEHEHIMEDKWYPYSGPPNAKQWKRCVYPNCSYFITRLAKKA